MDSLTSSSNQSKGCNNFAGARGKDATSIPETQHLETQTGTIQNDANKSTEHRLLHTGNDTDRQHQSTGQRKALPTGRPIPAAHNLNEPSSGADSSAPAKPAFTRGISVIDQTAVTSAAPTPAGEIQNPMSFGMGQSIARQRESHLPDEDLRERIRTMSKSEPLDDVAGDDDFGEDLSRQETEKAR